MNHEETAIHVSTFVRDLIKQIFEVEAEVYTSYTGLGLDVEVYHDDPAVVSRLIGRTGINIAAIRQLVSFWGRERKLRINVHIVPGRFDRVPLEGTV